MTKEQKVSHEIISLLQGSYPLVTWAEEADEMKLNKETPKFDQNARIHIETRNRYPTNS